MTAKIKYTVKLHPRPVKKVAKVMFAFGILLLLICNLLWTPFRNLPADLQAFAIIHFLPKVFFDLNNVSILILGVGFMLWLFRWRTGKIELTDEKLIIEGSYVTSFWLRSMQEVDIRDLEWAFHRWRIRLHSQTDVVEIKFRSEMEFENFSEKLVKVVGEFDNVQVKITT